MSEPAGGELPSFVKKIEECAWQVLVRVQPGASKTEIIGEIEGRLRIRLMAPAIENKANKALLAFMAKTLGLRLSQCQLVSGATSREKRVHLTPLQEPDWAKLLVP